MMRPGGQSQFSAHLVAQAAEAPAISTTLAFILANPGDALTVTGRVRDSNTQFGLGCGSFPGLPGFHGGRRARCSRTLREHLEHIGLHLMLDGQVAF